MALPLLEIDLGKESVKRYEVPNGVRATWIGGVGLGLFLLSREVRRGLSVRDPDCPVFIVPGPLTGTIVPQSSDWTIVTMNGDLPHQICASHAHGHFGARLRQAGWDGIVLRGQARAPVCVWISDGDVELRPAESIWGCDTFETQARLLGDAASETSVACIGPAGEQLVSGASVRADLAYGANQGGAGVAVGAKRVKAIVVHGTGQPPVHDPTGLEGIAAEWQEHIRSSTPGFPQARNFFGLKAMTDWLPNFGMVMGKNFTDPAFGTAWGERLAQDLKKWKVEAVGSWNCEAACHYSAVCTTGPMAGMTFTGYGGEIMEEVGPNLGIEDPGTAFMLAGVVDGYGLAALGPPRTIAMLMEAYSAGEVASTDLDGIELTWGNYDAVLTLLEKTVSREGIGELIARGLRATAQALGLEHRAVHMHGTGFNDHDLRAAPLTLFQSQVASGAGPTWQAGIEMALGTPEPDLGYDKENLVDPDDLTRVAEATSRTHKKKFWDDSLGVCLFAQTGFAGILDLATKALTATTGQRLTSADALIVGERIATLQRLMTLYLGYKPEEDFDMSQRLFEKIASGPAAGRGMTQDEFNRVRDEFYGWMGWSLETGAPSLEVLRRVGLEGFVVGEAPSPEVVS